MLQTTFDFQYPIIQAPMAGVTSLNLWRLVLRQGY